MEGQGHNIIGHNCVLCPLLGVLPPGDNLSTQHIAVYKLVLYALDLKCPLPYRTGVDLVLVCLFL